MMHKAAEEYVHSTSLDSLRSMLESGRIKSLRHIAKETSDKVVSVEPAYFPIRQDMPAAEAFERMREDKNPDKIFFTRNGYLSNYGDCIIKKRLGSSVRPHEAVNSIPEEFTTRRAISLKHNAEIFVPDEEAPELAKAYHAYKIWPKSELDLRPFGVLDRLLAFGRNLKRKFVKESAETDNFYRRRFGSNAMLAGSGALGTNVPGSSDIDVFVPYRRRHFFDRAVARLPEKYPGLKINKASLKREDKKTFTGNVNGQDIDVVLAYGPKAERFRNAFESARKKITPEMAREIVRKKQDLKNAWFFPEWRYKRYKNRIAEELGLREAYF